MMYGAYGTIPGRVDSAFVFLFALDVIYSVLQVKISQGINKPSIIICTEVKNTTDTVKHLNT